MNDKEMTNFANLQVDHSKAVDNYVRIMALPILQKSQAFGSGGATQCPVVLSQKGYQPIIARTPIDLKSGGMVIHRFEDLINFETYFARIKEKSPNFDLMLEAPGQAGPLGTELFQCNGSAVQEVKAVGWILYNMYQGVISDLQQCKYFDSLERAHLRQEVLLQQIKVYNMYCL